MAMNHDYYTLVHNYVLKKGMDRAEAGNIATSLAVLIPMRHDFGKEDRTWPENSHVVESIQKLHQGKDYKRIVPYDLDIPVIKLDSMNDLPTTTTYGQRYHIRSGDVWLETKPNGITEVIDRVLVLQITEPLGIDTHALSKLRERAAQQGLAIEVWDKSVDHPDNVIGLAKMKALFAKEGDKLLGDELALQRAEDQSSWSKPTNKLNIRERVTSRFTRMRNRQRRG